MNLLQRRGFRSLAEVLLRNMPNMTHHSRQLRAGFGTRRGNKITTPPQSQQNQIGSLTRNNRISTVQKPIAADKFLESVDIVIARWSSTAKKRMSCSFNAVFRANISSQ